MKNIFIFALISSILIPLTAVGQCYVDRHNTSKNTGWTSCTASAPPHGVGGDTYWLSYDFGHVYSLYQLHYWNHNHPDELTNGLQEVTIFLSTDGSQYTEWGTTTFNMADGGGFYEGEDGPNLNGEDARYMLIVASSNYGGSCYSLAEIRIGLEEITAPELVIDAKVLLSGPYNSSTGLMSDQLRTKNLLPLQEPYSGKASFVHVGEGGGEIVGDASVFDNTNDEDDIVDWVFVELRDKDDINTVVNTKSALIQRDGDIVDIDGESRLVMKVEADDYYLVIRHRNHLGVMSATPITFRAASSIKNDFTQDASLVYGGSLYDNDGTLSMFAGNANGANVVSAAQKQIRMTGPPSINDYSQLLSTLSDLYVSIIFNVYDDSDLNLDGNVRMTGPPVINDYSTLLKQLDDQYVNIIFQAF